MKKFYFLPKSFFGRLSVGLIVAFFVLYFVFLIIVASGYRGGETFFSNPALAIPALLMGASGTSSFFVGVYSIFRKKERSIFVLISTLIGLFILIFIMGEIVTPH